MLEKGNIIIYRYGRKVNIGLHRNYAFYVLKDIYWQHRMKWSRCRLINIFHLTYWTSCHLWIIFLKTDDKITTLLLIERANRFAFLPSVFEMLLQGWQLIWLHFLFLFFKLGHHNKEETCKNYCKKKSLPKFEYYSSTFWVEIIFKHLIYSYAQQIISVLIPHLPFPIVFYEINCNLF